MNSENNSKTLTVEHQIKVISPDKLFSDQFIKDISELYDCKIKSPLMYAADKDAFFQFVAVSKRRG